MKPLLGLFLPVFLAVALPGASGEGSAFEVSYPPSTKPGELQLPATYRLWIPPGVKTLRALIVHQHGCGPGSSAQSVTAASDLHWQALARKWDCALLGPTYLYTNIKGDPANVCNLWCDPRNGSKEAFLRSLADLGRLSGHPELETVPWCLWGHSGGGMWTSLMQVAFPDRIAAIFYRSGTGYQYWESGVIPMAEVPEAAMRIPILYNVGVKENDGPPVGAWFGGLAMFKAYRARGCPIGFAPDPGSGHETANSRYLAIPFFDACLAMRLPDKGSADRRLKPVPMAEAWLAPLLGDRAVPAAAFQGNARESVWLPNEAFAQKWADYVRTSEVSDPTPPPPPFHVQAAFKPAGLELTWEAAADLESGLREFVILRDGQPVAHVPEKPLKGFGRRLFQGMSYGDTPVLPLAEMRFIDAGAHPGEGHRYSIVAVNTVGLSSSPAEAR